MKLFGNIGTFELMMLAVGLLGGILGFNLINSLFIVEKKLSWGMISSIFMWLILMTIFILLSFIVEVSQKHYEETKGMHDIIKGMQERMYLDNKRSKKR